MIAKKIQHVDRLLLITTCILLLAGISIFCSAALGALARQGSSVIPTIIAQIVLGGVGGILALIVTMRIPYRKWLPLAPYLYAAAVLVTALVFIPHVGYSAGGARRWIALGPLSFQPSEIVKIACVMFLSALIANSGKKIRTFYGGIVIYAAVVALPALLLILEPDNGTLGVLIFATLAAYFASGASWKHFATLIAIGIIGLGGVLVLRPYAYDRFMTFLHPSADQLTTGYHINQSLIAIGSGGITGRGYGQGIQKFSYLPEPMSDSVFAVAGEELGFIGTTLLVLLFTVFAFRGLTMSVRAPEPFGAALGVGITMLFVTQAFVNIAAIVGLIPLTGIPLPLISHGGTAMVIMLAGIGILLNISRYATTAPSKKNELKYR